MGIEWNATYEVGVAEIDAQHRELFARVSALVEAMRAARGREEVTRTIRFLSDYVQQHFGMEETLMIAHSYPGAAQHLREHTEFISTFQKLSEQLETQGATAALAIEVNNKVCNWLIRHVLGTDKALGAYLRGRHEPPATGP